MHQNRLHIVEIAVDYYGPKNSQVKRASLPPFILDKIDSDEPLTLVTSHINLPRDGQKLKESSSI